jgi:hypothetical protein
MLSLGNTLEPGCVRVTAMNLIFLLYDLEAAM